MPTLKPSDLTALRDVAGKLGVSQTSLLYLLNFESGLNPLAANPNSSAKGLIQFIDSTARELGFADSQDLVNRFPDFEAQLRGPVYEYFRRSAPYPSDQSLFMKVFYPAYRSVPTNKAFPDSVVAVNPGIKTPGDYMARVYAKGKKLVGTSAAHGIEFALFVLALGASAFFAFRKTFQGGL